MKDTLVMDAFMQAYGKEHPENGLIAHTDQETQFTGGKCSLLNMALYIVTAEKGIHMIMH